MTALKDSYTSTGAKLYFAQEVMRSMRAGYGKVITCHVMATDICDLSCSFCSVQSRAGDVLPFSAITGFIDILMKYGLKSCVLSGGGNPILYKCKETGKNFNDIVDFLHDRGLQIGLISNGLAMRKFGFPQPDGSVTVRESWATVRPETLDKITWIRVSLAGLDHDQRECFIPDIDPTKTTLGMSYVAADVFFEPADPFHGKVSTPGDLITIGAARDKLPPPWLFDDRIPELTEQLRHYVDVYKPKYLRLLPNCLQPELLEDRAAKLQRMADAINPDVAFVQNKPPKAPKNCYLGYVHPVMAPSGMVFPCDSVVIAAADIGYKEGKPNHTFDERWAICHWSKIGEIYENPIRSLVDSQKMCAGCLFHVQNAILEGVVDGTADITPPEFEPEHVNFV